MPQELQLVYLKATGEPKLMHSVDAAEAIRLGDYVSVLPGPETGSVEAQMAARSFAMAAQGPLHPEMMTPEQREVARYESNMAEIRRLEELKHPVPEALRHAVAHTPSVALPHEAPASRSLEPAQRGASSSGTSASGRVVPKE